MLLRLGPDFQQDVADLPAHLLVAVLRITSCPFLFLGNSVGSSFAVTGLARDASRVLPLVLASAVTALMVGAMPRAGGQVILRAAVSAEDVLRAFDVLLVDGHRLGNRHLNVEAVVPAAKRCSWPVVLHGNEPYGADVQPFEGLVRP